MNFNLWNSPWCFWKNGFDFPIEWQRLVFSSGTISFLLHMKRDLVLKNILIKRKSMVTDSFQNTSQTHCKLLLPESFGFVLFSVASNIPSQQSFVLQALVPATRYTLRVSARNPAGTTVAQYVFVTRSTTSGLCFFTLIVKLNYYVQLYIVCTTFIMKFS